MIDVKEISKKYNIPHEKKLTAFETIVGYVKRQMVYENFYALKEITFHIDSGEAVGLIGKNGSGKTTLLKILGGVLFQTNGSFMIEGKVAPFFSLGAGFHHELTAQENLYLYGSILGMSRHKINEKLMTILRFADVERFKDTKLKNFSSGMISRLAFALMIQTDSDVFLLDEIFAIGDKDFVPQSIAVLEKYKQKGKTVILASHDLDLVAKYCKRAILLHKGEMKAFGNTKDVIQQYLTL